jgi:branched-subunit amino acid transport protein AzlD
MSVVLAVGVVGVGSLLLRLAPLLGARLVSESTGRIAGWAGLSVLAGMTVRTVAGHEDPSLPGAPLVAVVAVGAGLLLAFRGRSVPLSVAVGAGIYLLAAAAHAAFLHYFGVHDVAVDLLLTPAL